MHTDHSDQQGIQRRAHVRRLLEVAARVTEEGTQASVPAHVIDIARMGVGFVTDGPLDPAKRYILCFCFPGCATEDEATLDLVYSTPLGSGERFRNGARFLHLAEETVERIVDYVTTGTPFHDRADPRRNVVLRTD